MDWVKTQNDQDERTGSILQGTRWSDTCLFLFRNEIGRRCPKWRRTASRMARLKSVTTTSQTVSKLEMSSKVKSTFEPALELFVMLIVTLATALWTPSESDAFVGDQANSQKTITVTTTDLGKKIE